MLDKATLKTTIVSIMTDMLTRQNNSIDEFATRLSDAIDVYVKGAKIVYTSGLTAGSNPVVGTFNGNLE
jgi:hypothetical protein